MNENTAEFNLFLYEFEKLIKELDKVLVFMVKDGINDVFDVALGLVDYLIHTGCGSDN